MNFSYPPPTTGIGVAARVVVDPSAATLAAPGDTVQLAPSLTDVLGNPVAPVTSFFYLSYDENVATVSDSGLITAIATGLANIQVAYQGLGADVSIQVAPEPMTSTYVFANGGIKRSPKLYPTSVVGPNPPIVFGGQSSA
jgi:hypothetical protein